ncbi:MAG: 3-dehydroquinate synthase [Cytophagales bacterium]|nr:3-dehydroquinate synthase [Cytophagales bacterium]
MQLPDYVRIGQVQKGLAELLQHSFSAIAVLVDENTYQYCYPIVAPILPQGHQIIAIPSGEQHKNLQTCQQIWQALTNMQADRNALLINLGGGVISDMGGFCAATYKRGIRFVQIPTTLLAQVDASIGGKLGIDFQGFKNHIGVFQLPFCVLIDTSFLATLPWRQLRSGFAELLKHSLIADWQAWYELTRAHHLQDVDWQKVVHHSIAIKERIVSQDPHEKGLRKILNFGHTLGHAIETYFLENRPAEQGLLHGEAIAAGMIAEAWLAVRKTGLPQQEFEEIKWHLLQLYGKIAISQHEIASIAQLALQDKKNQNGIIQLSLIEAIGACKYNVPATVKELKEALLAYCQMPAEIHDNNGTSIDQVGM